MTSARAHASTAPDRDYGGVEAISAPPLEGAASADELADLRRRVEQLEAAAKAPPVVSPAPPRARPLQSAFEDPRTSEVGFARAVTPAEYGLRLGGYVQVQYLHNQLSEDQLQQGGTPLNRDGLAVRRGRLRIGGDWRWVAFGFELDGSTTRGPFVGVRQAHISGVWRNPNAKRPPYLMLTAGLTEVPFGYEMRLSQRDMLFMERSTGSLALFPGPVDIGLRLRGAIGPFRYDLAVMNGSPLDDVAGPNSPNRIDPTRRPDIIGRLGFDARPKRLAFSGGASFLSGTGLHAGQDATKNQLEWIDLNEDGSIDTAEIFTVPGTAALPSVRFGRWRSVPICRRASRRRSVGRACSAR